MTCSNLDLIRKAASTYRAHETHSLSMEDIIQRIAAGFGHERGEAAIEFVMALAIDKIRLPIAPGASGRWVSRPC